MYWKCSSSKLLFFKNSQIRRYSFQQWISNAKIKCQISSSLFNKDCNPLCAHLCRWVGLLGLFVLLNYVKFCSAYIRVVQNVSIIFTFLRVIFSLLEQFICLTFIEEPQDFERLSWSITCHGLWSTLVEDHNGLGRIYNMICNVLNNFWLVKSWDFYWWGKSPVKQYVKKG